MLELRAMVRSTASRRAALGAVYLLACSFAAPAAISAGGVPSYNFDIKPILSDRCYHCHGPDAENQDSLLRLDTRESSLTDLGGYAAVVPGKTEESELHHRIWSDDADQMPPPDSNLSLTDEEKRLIDRWIKAGAPFDKHWSFKPLPQTVEIPTSGSEWPRNEIDRFVERKHQQEGLSPTIEASKRKLVRRVTLALTGIPPTPQEVDNFLSDPSGDAYERLVDRLLSSPRYGERMAVDWLDLARYADTFGYQQDRYRAMWPWRDWVIKAFNDNLPYDQFATWQLAGDLMESPSREQVLATAFNRLHRQTNEGGSIEEEFRTEYVVDRVDTFGAAFLGLTVGCARCHDHKYDPLSQKEYYQLFAYFDNIDESGLYSHFTEATPTPTLDLTSDDQQRTLQELASKQRAEEVKLAKVRESRREAFDQWLAGSPQETELTRLIGDFTWDEVQSGKYVPNQADADEPGKLHDAPRLIEGQSGKALELNGENGFSTVVGGEFHRYDPFTIAMWIKTPDTKERAVVWHRSRASLDAGSRGYELLIEEGKLTASLIHFWPGNALSIRTNEELPVGRWVHVTVAYDGSSTADGLHMYWDGRPVATGVVRDKLTRKITYKDNNEAHKFTLGQRFRDRGFVGGGVDELKIFDRELSDHEVTALFHDDGYYRKLVDAGPARTPEESNLLYDYYLRNHDSQFAEATRNLQAARRKYAEAYDAVTEIMVMQEMPQPRPTHLLERGAYDAPGQVVETRTPDWLPPMDDHLPQNRLGLARWVTEPSHPLTARVAVNRIWQSFFGTGLVSTPLDFGSQGIRPSHPELLDWLARDFVDSGWDIKHLVKQIVTSATYRQSSVCPPDRRAADPENRFLARGPQFRLPAEMIRDSALASSGLLVEKMGGPPVKPYQPSGLWKEKGGATYTRDKGEGSYRRSVYTYWKRSSPPPGMMILDCPDREVGIAQRQVTSTPLQPLLLLNDPQFVEAARSLAHRVSGIEGSSIEQRLAAAFEICTSRPPSREEKRVISGLYQEQLELFEATPERAVEFLSVGDLPFTGKADPTQFAALTCTVEVIMNLNEAITLQ